MSGKFSIVASEASFSVPGEAVSQREGTLFIFDEPRLVHFADIQKLLTAFHHLVARGHSLLIIEHNLEVIKCADHLIDL